MLISLEHCRAFRVLGEAFTFNPIVQALEFAHAVKPSDVDRVIAVGSQGFPADAKGAPDVRDDDTIGLTPIDAFKQQGGDLLRSNNGNLALRMPVGRVILRTRGDAFVWFAFRP